MANFWIPTKYKRIDDWQEAQDNLQANEWEDYSKRGGRLSIDEWVKAGKPQPGTLGEENILGTIPSWATTDTQPADLGKGIMAPVVGSILRAKEQEKPLQDIISAPITGLLSGKFEQRPPTEGEMAQGQYAYQPTWADIQAYKNWQTPSVKLPGSENPVLGALSGAIMAQPSEQGGTELSPKSGLELLPWLAVPGGFRGSGQAARSTARGGRQLAEEIATSEVGGIGKPKKPLSQLAETTPKIETPAPRIEQPLIESPKPPKPGLTPEEEISRVKLLEFTKQLRSEKLSTKITIKEATGRKMGALEGVYAEPQGRETFIKASVALKGQMKPDVIPPQMTEADINNIFNIAAKAELASGTGKISRGVNYDLQDALNKMFGLDPANLGKHIRPQPHQIELMAKAYGDDVGKALMDARSGKVFDRIMNITGIPRVLQTMLDHSAVLNQNFVLTVTHPVKAARNIVTSLKSLKNVEVANAEIKRIRANKFYDDAIETVKVWEAPVEDTMKFAPLSSLEESFQTTLTMTKNSVLRKLLTPVRLSNRIYALYGNLQRFDVTYQVMGNMEKTGLYADWVASGKANSFGQLINWASGRGSLPAWMSGKGAVVANQIFYSPRFMFSRVEYPVKAAQTIFAKSTPAPIRKEAIRQLVATVGTGTTILALIKQSGVADVEVDPRSSDFGTIRIGNTRIKFWGGWLPYARFFTQLATNERKVVDSGKIVGLNRLNTSIRMGRSKLAPFPGLITDLMAGETYIGEEFEATPEFATSQAQQRLAPLFISDVIDAIRTEGWIGGVTAIPGFFGAGVSSYKPTQETGTGGGLQNLIKPKSSQTSKSGLQNLIK